jgi:hypothetical protein
MPQTPAILLDRKPDLGQKNYTVNPRNSASLILTQRNLGPIGVGCTIPGQSGDREKMDFPHGDDPPGT